MTDNQITKEIASKINRDRVGGYSIEQLWHGIHPDERYKVAFSLKSLIESGKVEIHSKRVFDNCGNAETVTSYRKVWN